MTGAANHRGTSVQDVETPRDFLDAVETRFGKLTADLACTLANSKAVDAYVEGDEDPWPSVGNLWLNPPYGDIPTWVKRCAEWSSREYAKKYGQLLLLVPASVGTNWFAGFFEPFAFVMPLRPRLTFVGHSSPFPKDLMLCRYGGTPAVGFQTWGWR